MAETNSSIDVSTPTREGFSITATTPQTLNVNADAVTQKMDITASSTTPLGLSVTPDLSMYYSDVSKGYAEQAEASARRAENSADVANEAAKNILENEQVQAIFDNLEIIEAAPENAQVAQEQALLSKGYADIANESAITASQKADVATEQANIILEQVANAETYANNANTSAVSADASANSAKEYMENAKASASAAKASETNAKTSASEALASKNSASSSATSASASATTATNKASEAETSASIATNQAQIATQQANIAKEEVAKLSTVYKYKGSVATFSDLPTTANTGDVYDTQETGMNYAWNGTEWDELGGTFDVSWGSLKGNISDNADLQTALNSKANTSDIPDLTDYVKNTDYATGTKAGVVRSGSYYGTQTIGGFLAGNPRTLEQYKEAINQIFISKGTFENIKDDYIKRGLTENTIEFTDEEKISARTLIGAVGNTDYATDTTDGVVKTNYSRAIVMSAGSLGAGTRTLKQYNDYNQGNMFIGKGTLENIKNDLVKRAITTNDIELTAEEKTNVSNWLDVARKSEIPDTTNFITIRDVEAKNYLTEVPSEYVTDTELSTYAYDKATVDGKIADAVTGGTVDLSGYAKLTDIPDVSNFITATDRETLENKNINAEENYISNLTIDNFAWGTIKTMSYEGGEISDRALLTEGAIVREFALKAEIPDTSNFVTKSEIPTDYATKTELEQGLETKQPLGDYALSSDIPDVSNLATKDEIPSIDGLVPYIDFSEFVEDINNKVNDKQDTLTAGENITIENNVISAVVSEGNAGSGMPIGAIYSLNCTDKYVPEGNLPCDGTEYTRAQFNDLWENYLTGVTYYAFTASELDYPTEDGKTSITVYTTTPEPTSDSIIYIYEDDVFVEMAGAYTSTGDGIEFTYVAPTYEEGLAYAYATRDASKDIKDTLLNTCTYAEYEQELATYGQCAKFAVDEANAKFRVPFIKDGSVIQQALTDSELGKAYNAGLPNITGTLNGACITSTEGGTQSGALYLDGNQTDSRGADTEGSTKSQLVGFDASLSNPTYGNSDTVQPNAVALRYFVVVANGQINESMMDWSEWASGLQGKVNSDLSNCSKPYIIEAFVDGTSGYNLYSNGYCEQWGFFTGVTGTYTITLLKSYANTDYSVCLTNQYTAVMSDARVVNTNNKTTSSFQIVHGTNSAVGCYWECKGYLF